MKKLFTLTLVCFAALMALQQGTPTLDRVLISVAQAADRPIPTV
jgi:hypothetical protein